MADIKWIKIVIDIFDDEKILLIESLPEADSLIVIWFKLLCLAGKNNNHGVFLLNETLPYTDEMFATIFRRPINTVRLAIKTFETYGMIEIVNGAVTIPNWGKHQNFDKIEARNEYQRVYMREYRAGQKQLASGKPSSKPNGNTNGKVNVSALEEIREDKNKIKKESKKKGFVPPTLEQIQEYCKERNNDVDPKRFFDYFEASGWVDSKGNKVKIWKQKIITWENGNVSRQVQQTKNTKHESSQPSYSMDELDRIIEMENEMLGDKG